MRMRSILWTVVGATSLLGCGLQPQHYRVAIDESPLQELPSTCYRTGEVPADRTNNVVDVQQWSVWEGVEDRKYLQVGNLNYRLGDAYNISINGDAVISQEKADKPTFVAERVDVELDRTITTRATYTLDSQGETLEGTLALSSSCEGANCDRPACEATVPFVGRRLDVERVLAVGEGN
jgi:hypothetical protein